MWIKLLIGAAVITAITAIIGGYWINQRMLVTSLQEQIQKKEEENVFLKKEIVTLQTDLTNVKLSNKSLEGLINLKAQENQFIRDELARFNNIDNASRKRIQSTTNNIRNSTLQERIARIRNSDKVDLQLTIINKNLTCLTENFGNPEKCGNDIFNPDEIEVK